MTTTKKLARILTDEVEGGYRMTLEADDGQIFRVSVTEDQVHDIIVDLEELLDAEDDEAAADEKEHVGEEQPS